MIQRLADGNWTTGLWYQEQSLYHCSHNQCPVGLMLKSQFDCYGIWKPFVPGRRQVRYCDKKTSSLFWHFCNFLPKFCRKYFVSDISKGGAGTKIVTGSSLKKVWTSFVSRWHFFGQKMEIIWFDIFEAYLEVLSLRFLQNGLNPFCWSQQFFLKVGQPRPLFHLFSSLRTN